MTREPLKIEELFDRLGAVQAPQEVAHRYKLRRSLLCSRYFDDEQDRQERWNRLVSFTAPLFAGGMLVVIFSMVGSSLNELPVAPLNDTDTIVAAAEIPSDQELTSTEKNGFVDFRNVVPLYDMVPFAQVENANFVFTH
jgi:hypothetical protein